MAIFAATVLSVSTPLDRILSIYTTSLEPKKKAFVVYCQNIKNHIGIRLNSIYILNLKNLFFLKHRNFPAADALIWLPIQMGLSIRVVHWKQKHFSWSAKILTNQLENNWRTPCKLSFNFQTDISISLATDFSLLIYHCMSLVKNWKRRHLTATISKTSRTPSILNLKTGNFQPNVKTFSATNFIVYFDPLRGWDYTDATT